ncbi:hypothetical protein BDR06DRAFT_949919 [Suillus hirtellus]|nr:hypothetical protein BDR06DRAFT_949919 [Suillus hirtellus]
MSEASFRLSQAPLTPQQVLLNIFAVSVLISTSTLCRVNHSTYRVTHAASNLTTSTVTLSV